MVSQGSLPPAPRRETVNNSAEVKKGKASAGGFVPISIRLPDEYHGDISDDD